VELIGTVVRLQVQRSRLKPGNMGARVYDPAPLLEVAALEVGPRGVTGDGHLDVHHADHPDTRNNGLRNGLSLLPKAHYDRLRARFGEHLVDGAAGESLLLDTAGPWTLDDLAGDLLLQTVDGELLPLGAVRVAAPCVEFSRFCLRSTGDAGDAGVEAALEELDHGTRGFYAEVQGTGRLERGARLLRR
jgi:hypothetical protein